MSFEAMPDTIRENILLKKYDNRKAKLISAIAGTACITILFSVSLNLTMSLEKIKDIQLEKFERNIGEFE